MLETIRKRTTSWVVKGLLLLLVLSFAVWGIGDIFRGGREATIAKVGDTKITSDQLSREFRREMDRIQHLQEMGAMKAGLNLSTHLTDLKDIRDGAMRNGAWSAAVTAEVSRGKAAGLYINRSELTVNKVESMSKDDILARMQELSLDTAGILPSVDVIDVESELVEDDADSPLGTQLSQNQSG